MSRRFVIAIVGLAALQAAAPTAAELPPDILVQSSRVTITRADFDAELASVPPGLRTEFAASSDRLSKLMNSMLETRTLAADARANGNRCVFVPTRKSTATRGWAHARFGSIANSATNRRS